MSSYGQTVGKDALSVKAHMPCANRQTCQMRDDPATNLAVNLRWLIEREGSKYPSQALLGSAAKINQRTVGRILNTEHSPKLDTIKSLARLFNCNAADLVSYRMGAAGHVAPAAAKPHPPEEFVVEAMRAIQRAQRMKIERANQGGAAAPAASSRKVKRAA